MRRYAGTCHRRVHVTSLPPVAIHAYCFLSTCSWSRTWANMEISFTGKRAVVTGAGKGKHNTYDKCTLKKCSGHLMPVGCSKDHSHPSIPAHTQRLDQDLWKTEVRGSNSPFHWSQGRNFILLLTVVFRSHIYVSFICSYVSQRLEHMGYLKHHLHCLHLTSVLTYVVQSDIGQTNRTLFKF